MGSLTADSGLARHWPELAQHPVLIRAEAAITAAADAISRLILAGHGNGAPMDDLRDAVTTIAEAARTAEELRATLDAVRTRRRN